jgi:hypothetical protein
MVNNNIQPRHRIILRGAASPANSAALRPTILEIRNQDFIPALLADLEKNGGAGLRVKEGGQDKMRLFQPVHRVFHPVLLEACCSQPGEPRLDPARILAAGAVIRRRQADGSVQGWMKKDGEILGWKTVNKAGDYDPDPGIRRCRCLGKNRAVLEKLGPGEADRWQESFTTLFVAPPETCAEWGRTFIYGLPALASRERPEQLAVFSGQAMGLDKGEKKIVTLPQPDQGRFDDSGATYEICCFVRVKQGECPPATVWTEPSEPFAIIPWYESSGVEPVQVELPELSEGALKKLKPDVVFKVPKDLRNILEKIKLDKILDGVSDKGNFDIGMICGFSIPIITICAFIVLQIFLKLLNIVFWWMPFIRICLPLP